MCHKMLRHKFKSVKTTFIYEKVRFVILSTRYQSIIDNFFSFHHLTISWAISDVLLFMLLCILKGISKYLSKTHARFFQQEVNHFRKNKAFVIHIFFIRPTHIGVSLRYFLWTHNLQVLSFQIFISIQRFILFLWENMKISLHCQPLYSYWHFC